VSDSLIEVLAQLQDLAEKYPERAKAAFESESGKIVLSELRKAQLAQDCQAFTPEGFDAHYELFSGIEPPPHVKRWIRKAFKAHEAGRGFALKAFRGSWKTTSLGVHFMSYFIAHHPLLTNMVVWANDDSAEKVGKAVAALIEHHPNWEIAYPNIKPDVKAGWSVNGYYIMDTSMPYSEWKKLRASTIDPTLVCGGLGSTRINGKHPTGMLYCDDIHDLNNSTSTTERATVVKQMTSVVLKTVIREDDKLKTWVFVVGVPWARDDTYQLLMDSGQYDYEVLPVMRPAQEGEEGAVYIDGVNQEKGVTYEDIQGWWVLTWPEKFAVKSIMFERSLGKFEFWQMMMMDIDTAGAGSLKYYTFPTGEIDFDWFVQPGVDPTNVDKPPQEYARRSKFAIAYLGERPQGGGVLIDGVLESCGLAQAINYMLAGQTRFKNCKPFTVENVGGGAMFIQAVRLNSTIRLIESGVRGITDKVVSDKRTRFLNNVAPYFEDGTILVSDENTPFLNAFRSLMDNFFDLDPKHSEEFDVADSVFHALRNSTAILSIRRREQEAARKVKRVRTHPLAGIRDFVGYGQSYTQ